MCTSSIPATGSGMLLICPIQRMTPKRGGSFTSTMDPTSNHVLNSAFCSATAGDRRLWNPLEERDWSMGGDMGGACGLLGRTTGGSRAGLGVLSGGGFRAALGTEEDGGWRAFLAVTSMDGWMSGRFAGVVVGCDGSLLGDGG